MHTNALDNNAIGGEAHDLESPRLGHEARSAVAKEITMVRPESQPRCIELDSAGDGVPASGNGAISELPTPTTPAARPNSGHNQTHPQGPVWSRYHDTRSRHSSLASSHPPSLIPGPLRTQASIQSRMEDASSPGQQDDAHNGQDPEFRPNLNPTEDEREKNQHVTSWEKL